MYPTLGDGSLARVRLFESRTRFRPPAQVLCPAGTLKKHACQLQNGDIAALPPPGVDGAGPATAPTGAGAAALAEDLMSQLRRAHCALVRDMVGGKMKSATG